MSTFYEKYLKYKNKYLELKRQIGGVPESAANQQVVTQQAAASQQAAPQQAMAMPQQAMAMPQQAMAMPQQAVAMPQQAAASQQAALAPISIPQASSAEVPLTPREAPPVSNIAPPKVMPTGWSTAMSKTSGKYYYTNNYTKETQWEIPTEPASKERKNTARIAKPIVNGALCDNKIKIGSYVKFIKIDERYMKAWENGNPQQSGESEDFWRNRIKKRISEFLQLYAFGKVTDFVKCTGINWSEAKENMYSVLIPGKDKVINALRSEIIPITEKEYQTMVNARNSRNKGSVNEEYSHIMLQDRIVTN